MKKLVYKIENQYLLYACAVFGLALILLPQYLVKAVPYALGGGLIVYGGLRLFTILKSGDREARPAKYLVFIVVGLVSLLQRAGSLTTIGVIWAMLTLQECVEEIDEFYETRELHILPMAWTVFSIVLACMLLHAPAHHFVFHMRILGLEVIAASYLHWRDKRA